MIIHWLEDLYLYGFALLHIVVTLLPLAGGESGNEFLPLLLTSVYCAVGLAWAFVRLSLLYIKTY